jgi:hypothetical protein
VTDITSLRDSRHIRIYFEVRRSPSAAVQRPISQGGKKENRVSVDYKVRVSFAALYFVSTPVTVEFPSKKIPSFTDGPFRHVLDDVIAQSNR